MTYLDYIVLLEKCDHQQSLSGNACKLYLKLVALANSIGWPDEFTRSDPYVAAVCGFSRNTMKSCRDELESRGLLVAVPGGNGRGALTTYQLIKVSKSDTLPSKKVSDFDTISPIKVSDFDTLPPKTAEKVSEKVSNFDTLYIDKDKERVEAADAAPLTSSSSPKSESKPAKSAASSKPKSKGATHEEIAALELPFNGEEFAATWQTFYTTNTKQVGKPLTAFALMLTKLAKRQSEAFAVAMLEAAIQGDWSGVENGGTARFFIEWQAEQARNPAPAPIMAAAFTEPLPEVNEEFIAQQQAEAKAKRQQHFDRMAAAAAA